MNWSIENLKKRVKINRIEILNNGKTLVLHEVLFIFEFTNE